MHTRIPPPVIMLVAAAAMWALHRWLPLLLIGWGLWLGSAYIVNYFAWQAAGAKMADGPRGGAPASARASRLSAQ
jgi:hypothetical protein